MSMRETKACPACEIVKPITEFHASNQRAGCRTMTPGVFVQSRCKTCQNAEKNKYRERNRDFLRQEKLRVGCADCGYIASAVALDFHHTGKKRFSLSSGRAAMASLKLLESEIANCVVLCANCHRVRHHGSCEA